jgi:hypothetical protein
MVLSPSEQRSTISAVYTEYNVPEELNNHFLSSAYSKARTLPVWPFREPLRENEVLSHIYKACYLSLDVHL